MSVPGRAAALHTGLRASGGCYLSQWNGRFQRPLGFTFHPPELVSTWYSYLRCVIFEHRSVRMHWNSGSAARG